MTASHETRAPFMARGGRAGLTPTSPRPAPLNARGLARSAAARVAALSFGSRANCAAVSRPGGRRGGFVG